MLLTILGSLFLASSLSNIFARIIISRLSLNLFSGGLSLSTPSFGPELAATKTYDLVEFVSFVVLAIALFGINQLTNKNRGGNNRLFSIVYLLAAIFIYLQVHFAASSGFFVLVLAILVQSFFLLSHKVKITNSSRRSTTALANGLFLGFYLMTIANRLTTSIALPLILISTAPILYYLLGGEKSKFTSSYHLIFVAAAAFPYNFAALGIIGVLTLAAITLLPQKTIRAGWIYSLFVIFVIVYNPLYYFGTFDSVEEGFWLGWLQRILSGQTVYRDFAAYHPPIFIWGLGIFSKLFGASMKNFRLFTHIGQIGGMFLIYLTINRLCTKTITKIVAMAIVLALLSTGVRNNVEIRLGTGLLAITPMFYYFQKYKNKYLVVSGALTSIAFFTSIEIGLATLLAIAAAIIVTNYKAIRYFLAGLAAGAFPIIFLLVVQGSLMQFYSQISYYATAFSGGYLNTAVERPENLTLLQWHVISRFLLSSGWAWEIARFAILAGGFYLLSQRLKTNLSPLNRFALLIVIFCVFLTRVTLGRFDYYHLLFLLIPAITLLAFLLEQNFSKYPYASAATLAFVAVLFFHNQLNLGLVQNQLIKYQTYGNPAGSYPSYNLARTGIIVGIEVNTQETERLVHFVTENTNPTDKIFVFPAMPELYFLANRNNATSFDTPLAFFTDEYQIRMISELETNKPKFVIYNPNKSFGNLTADSLHIVNEFIKASYIETQQFGDNQVLVKDQAGV